MVMVAEAVVEVPFVAEEVVHQNLFLSTGMLNSSFSFLFLSTAAAFLYMLRCSCNI